jgi:hypothetical protein
MKSIGSCLLQVNCNSARLLRCGGKWHLWKWSMRRMSIPQARTLFLRQYRLLQVGDKVIWLIFYVLLRSRSAGIRREMHLGVASAFTFAVIPYPFLTRGELCFRSENKTLLERGMRLEAARPSFLSGGRFPAATLGSGSESCEQAPRRLLLGRLCQGGSP